MTGHRFRRPARAIAILGWRGLVIRICRKSVAGELAINFGAALFRMFELFDHHDSGALAHNKSVAVTIEWPRSPLRFVVATTERSHRRKTGEANRNDRRFRTTGEKYVRVAEFNDPPRFADGVVGRSASSDNAHVRPTQTKLHRNDAAGHVADEHRDGERGNARRSLVHQNIVLILERFESADPTGDQRPEAVAINPFEIDAAVLNRLFC